jgi:inward rectifier potassium channel
MHDLKLERSRNPSLSRSWTVMHRITEESPLWNATPELLAKQDAELVLTLTGLDETSSNRLHASGRYAHDSIRWGARHADILSELPDGRIRLDLTRFHEVVPTEPGASFPYPQKP